MGPKHSLVMTFIGHPGPDSITLEAQHSNTRWIFTDITPTSFDWRNEDFDDTGNVIVRQRFVASRPQP